MGLTEIYCEQIDNIWKWIEDNREEAFEYKALLIETLVANHLTIQNLMGDNKDDPEEIMKRIRLAITAKWIRVVWLREEYM